MKYKPVESITLTKANNPDVLMAVNELAWLEDNGVHDIAARLLLESANERIAKQKHICQEKSCPV